MGISKHATAPRYLPAQSIEPQDGYSSVRVKSWFSNQESWYSNQESWYSNQESWYSNQESWYSNQESWYSNQEKTCSRFAASAKSFHGKRLSGTKNRID
jgi:hypothetical protein